MADFYLIRHAESTGNTNPHLINGRSNHYPLTEKGLSQARAVGKRLLSDKILPDIIAASPAVRAQQTAHIICQELGISSEAIKTFDEIQELSQGDWEGKLREDVYTPEVLESINLDNWNFRAPKGESQKELEERMHAWTNKFEYGKTIVAVSHAMAIKCLLRKLLDSSPKMTYHWQLSNASITHIRKTPQTWQIVKVNDHAHLHQKL